VEDIMLNDESAIRKRAYEIWQAEGERHGSALAHWLRAEEEVGRAKPTASRRHATAPRRRTSTKAVAA
jgi:hypothetical protein